MHEFRIGDIVKGISVSYYSVTNTNMTQGIVNTVYNNGVINITIVKHTDRSQIGHSFSVESRFFELVKKADLSKQKKVTCSNCGTIINGYMSDKSSNGKYVCYSCAMVKDYSTKSTNVFHKHAKSNKTYGFELECFPHSNADKLSMINRTYGLIPTEDGSLQSGGIEFKTPIYNGLYGLRKLFTSFNKYVDFSRESCGQHINIGDTKKINYISTSHIREYAENIFNPLYEYMRSHRDDTERVCGRFFTEYADKEYCYTAHSSWIALSEENRIEFRLSKFRTPDQYFCLTNMWTEMIDCLIDNFLPNPNYDTANSVSKKLINIFEKYADGKAKCQKYKRIAA